MRVLARRLRVMTPYVSNASHFAEPQGLEEELETGFYKNSCPRERLQSFYGVWVDNRTNIRMLLGYSQAVKNKKIKEKIIRQREKKGTSPRRARPC